MTPVAGYALSSGKHQIRLERKGYRIKRDTINVTGTRTMSRGYTLQREGR